MSFSRPVVHDEKENTEHLLASVQKQLDSISEQLALLTSIVTTESVKQNKKISELSSQLTNFISRSSCSTSAWMHSGESNLQVPQKEIPDQLRDVASTVFPSEKWTETIQDTPEIKTIRYDAHVCLYAYYDL